jgi:transcription factor E
MQKRKAKKAPRKTSSRKKARPASAKKSPAKKRSPPGGARRKKPATRSRAPSKKKKKTLKKSVARKAIRSAVAKRAIRKKLSGGARPSGAKKGKKPSRAKPRRPAPTKLRAKPSPKRKAKKPAKKAAAKPQKARARSAPSRKPPEKPKTKSERLGGELNRQDISRLLSDRYTRHLVIDSGGEYALEIIRGFVNNTSDEDMAKKLKIKISDVRATLNKLHSLGIVDYTRHKDSETGWFSYYWFLNVAKMKEWVGKRIDEDHRKMDFSGGEHYYCPGCGGASIHDFVSASDFGFKCPTCSASLDYLSEEKANELFPMRSFRKPLL